MKSSVEEPKRQAAPPDNGEILELSEGDLLEPTSVQYGGRYELLSMVGSGSYGSVYRALDTELDEIVAVKILRREHLAQADNLKRFRREVGLARRVAHPNVARTYDIGRHEGERFLTMEYIDGRPLTRYCPIGASISELLPIRLVVEIATQLCAGLSALHAAGIVHQDMKPDNVLVGHDARVVITDFGIARALSDGDADVNVGAALTGTPAYMAPEQVRGYGRIDTRADLYALGVMLFQMMTGQIPFPSATGMETALARLYEEPIDARTIRPQLPKALAEILRRCLAREPDERFQTADDLAAALSAERPPGEDLADYLKARAQTSRCLAGGGEEAGGRGGHVNEPLPEETATIIASPAAPLLPLAVAKESRQLSVALLLFHYQGESDSQYLAGALTEEIIDRLSESEGLRVTSFGVVRSLPADARDPGVVGRQLLVKVILDGSLRVTARGLQATVRLVDVDSRLQFAVRRFERPDRNILALAIEIAQGLGGLLTVNLNQSHSDLVSDAVAVDLYVQARHHHSRMDADAAKRSIELFEQALRRLPDEPTLLTGYASALSRYWFFAGVGAAERAKTAAERAVQAAPEQGAPYVALAAVQLNTAQLPEAAASLRRALMRSPQLADAHEQLGHLLTETGPLELAFRHLNFALLLDKSVPRVRISLARAHLLDGQAKEALLLLDTVGIDPGYLPIFWIAKARSISWINDQAKARELLADPELLRPELKDTRLRFQLIAGERHITADEYLPPSFRLSTASIRARQFACQILAEYHCLCQNYDAALSEVREAVALQFADLLWMDRCPLLKPLHGKAEFSVLRQQTAERALRVQQALGIVSNLTAGLPPPPCP